MEKKFRRGDVVWAKVRGFAWWPAMVKGVSIKISKEEDDSEIRETSVLVYFIGDDSHSSLPLNKIEKFNVKFEEFSKTKKKSLLNSIEIAKKIISGEIPFEKHLHYAKRKKILKKLKKKEDDKQKEQNSNISLSSFENFQNVFNNKEHREITGEESPQMLNKKILGLKKNRSSSDNNNFNPMIDLRVKEDSSKNIKIKININVNNNLNNTVNITTIGGGKNMSTDNEMPLKIQRKKIVNSKNDVSDDDASDDQLCSSNKFTENENSSELSDAEDSIENYKEELVEAVKSLLFYKIDMPTSSSNKSILNTLELIHDKLNILKNCNIYTVTKDLIPILSSFLSHKNQFINTRSSELISIIKEKVLSEIFDFENEKNELNKFFENPDDFVYSDLPDIKDDNIFCSELKLGLDNNNNNKNNEGLNSRNFKLVDDSILDMRFKKNKKLVLASNLGNELRKAQSLPIEIQEDPTEKESNIFIKSESFMEPIQIPNSTTNENNFFELEKKNFNLIALNKKKVLAFNSNQMQLLFKDFISEEKSNLDFKETLNKGFYSENFYQNVYNKFNGLSESLANKRKHVCLKLLNILKLILPEIETETLKKTIIFIEYSIRTNDPTLGIIYKKKLENFYDNIKDILSITTDTINLNIKLKNW